MMATFDSNLEWIEAYLSGDLNPAEQQTFEQKLAKDPELKKTFEEHKKLRQSVEWASLSGSLEEVKRMHEAMNDEQLKLEPKRYKTTYRLNRTLSMAATLVFGVLIATLYFKVSINQHKIAGEDQNNHVELFGSGGDEIPLFEEVFPVSIEVIADENLTRNLSHVRLQIFDGSPESLRIDTVARSLVLFTPYAQIVNLFKNKDFLAIYTIRPRNLSKPVFQLISDFKIYSLPVDEESWNQIVIK